LGEVSIVFYVLENNSIAIVGRASFFCSRMIGIDIEISVSGELFIMDLVSLDRVIDVISGSFPLKRSDVAVFVFGYIPGVSFIRISVYYSGVA